ncbi:ATP12 family chaperone protein [Qipengyuania sp.]|uniref:ATP12 family chaperone protein n=1 Tax=Qipengyuania sp. TaxID=2004515 RepID=UPI0035C861AA
MKRFYKEARSVDTGIGWQVELDGRPIKTQGGGPQVVPGENLSHLLAAEWSAQGEEIDPRSFRHRDMADYAIDSVAPDRDAAVEGLLRYAETDTLCYRADPDEALWKRQQDVWEPLLTSFEDREGIKMQRVSGIIHRAQDPRAIEAIRGRLHELDDFTLAALTTLTSLATSLVIGLAALDGADGEFLWSAANLEEEWQAELWGSDEEAQARRQTRKDQFLGALDFAQAAAAA